MFKLIDGDIKKVKAEMKEQKKLATAQRKALAKKYGRGDIRFKKTVTNEDMLMELECYKVDVFFTVTTTVPAWFGDFLVNYQLVKEFEKKLKGFIIELKIVECKTGRRELHIAYCDWHSKSKGRIELNELPKDIFGKLKHIPQVEQA